MFMENPEKFNRLVSEFNGWRGRSAIISAISASCTSQPGLQRSFEGRDGRTSAFGPDGVDLVERIGQLARIIPDRQIARCLIAVAWWRATATDGANRARFAITMKSKSSGKANWWNAEKLPAIKSLRFSMLVCTESLSWVDGVMESPKLA
jgi:hypothetical protein